ncbi:glycerate kinase [Desulfovibrio sp. OH1186_COT-070]|uniref:glycerate kinase type-2 family protein n=1 Tax=unclassified Desulfovibrio TaxID=2593640 RepID=UPI0039088AB8
MMRRYKEILRQIFSAALEAVAPDKALLRHMRMEGAELVTPHGRWNLEGRQVAVLGAGKGVAPMAAALEQLLGPYLATGMVVTKYGHGLNLQRIRQKEAGHPVPDQAGVAAAEDMLRLARSLGENHLAICLFTGGASALTPAPAPGLTLEDLQATTEQLLRCGATINDINALRKHLSVFGGGQLARAVAPAPLLSVIVSDVVGDPLDVIASGPSVPDPTTFADCAAIVERLGLAKNLPPAVLRHLEKGLAGLLAETPKADDPVFCSVQNILAANNRQALEAAATAARALGFEAEILGDSLVGEAKTRAVELADMALARAAQRTNDAPPLCLLAGGETTVTITGTGRGGRNQEMALAAALALEKTDRVCALFAGTDGTDGPTDAAGGYAFASSVEGMGGREAACAFLRDNNSHAALSFSDDLFFTGPTRTNVMDLAVLLVAPALPA